MQAFGGSELGDVLQRFPLAYLITTGVEGRAHVVAAAMFAEADTVLVHRTGPTTHGNVLACPAVTILCPPADQDGYSLIIDGLGAYDGDTLVIVAQKAILHRDNPAREPGPRCGDECRRLSLTYPTA